MTMAGGTSRGHCGSAFVNRSNERRGYIVANQVTNVVVSIHVKLPGSNLIKVEDVLTGGVGTFLETLIGGQSTIDLTLTSAKQVRPLRPKESVFVSGTRDGMAFTFPGPLQTIQPHEPWRFKGKFGSTGP
jgi:hypothetical protein